MSSGKDISDMRRPYNDKRKFREADLISREPIGQFRVWFDEACNTDGIVEPNAMALATADRSGRPSVRMILLKGFGEDGFKFFTNYDSRKGTDLKDNPHCSLMFYWEPLKRQPRLDYRRACLYGYMQTGYTRLPVKVLDDLIEQMERNYPGEKTIPRPENWGGYVVRPSVVEFWQGQTSRVHDRLVFRKPDQGEVTDPSVTKPGENGWVIERLNP